MDKEYLLKVIRNITAEKDGKNIVPDFALREEIMKRIYTDMRQCLQELLKDKAITYNRTISSWAVKVNRTQNG